MLIFAVSSLAAPPEVIPDPVGPRPKPTREEAHAHKTRERAEETWKGWTTHSPRGARPLHRREGELIVRYRQDPEAASRRLKTGDRRLGNGRWLGRNLELVRFDEAGGYESVARALQADPDVAAVEPNLRFERQDAGEPDFREDRRSKQGHMAKLRAITRRHASDLFHPGRGRSAGTAKERIRIGILDTGIDRDHPDLAGAVAEGFNALHVPVPGPAPADPEARDEEDADSTERDYNGHGTMVAGIIAARVDSAGVDGIDDQALLHGVKVLDRHGIGDLAAVLAGLRWAIDRRVDLICMSFGSYASSESLSLLVAEAAAAGITLVAAAGNDFGDDATYPARYPQVLAVGSIEEDFSLCRFSNWGSDIDLFAPGFQLHTTTPLRSGEPYGSMTGTSASAAYVTGVLSLLKSHGMEASAAVAAARATVIRATHRSNPTARLLPILNVDRLLAEAGKVRTARLCVTSLEALPLPAAGSGGALELDYRILNCGNATVRTPEIRLELSSGDWTRAVPLAGLPSLKPSEEHRGRLSLPLATLLPREWTESRESRIFEYRLVGGEDLEGGLKGTFVQYAPGTPKLEVQAVWIHPMRFHESLKDRKISVKLANRGNARLSSMAIRPTIWEGSHESVWRSPNRPVGSSATVGPLEPGETGTFTIPAPGLDSLPYEFTLDLAFDAGSNSLNYLQGHRFSPAGTFVGQYAQVVHQDVARQAVRLLAEQGIHIPELHGAGSPYLDGGSYHDWNSLPSQAKYTTEWWTDAWLAANLPATLRYTLVNGSHDCDGIDVSSQKYGADTWDTHFWIVDNGDNDGLNASPSAYDKIRNLMLGNASGGLLRYGALAHYRQGHKKAAWWFLGHAVHLIGDLSLGSHVNEENAHGVIRNGVGIGDVYHGWMDAGNYAGSDWSNALAKGGALDPYVPVAEGNPLRFLAYSTAQVGNSFPWAHTGDGTSLGKEGNRDLLGNSPRYGTFLSPVLASLSSRPRALWHINKNEVMDACPGLCCPCADECQLVDVVGSNETVADCHDRDGHADRDNTDGPPTLPPSNTDGDIRRIRDSAYPFAIRAAAGLIYWFALETGQLGYRAVMPISPILM